MKHQDKYQVSSEESVSHPNHQSTKSEQYLGSVDSEVITSIVRSLLAARNEERFVYPPKAKEQIKKKVRGIDKLKKVASTAMLIFGSLSQVSGVEKIKPEGGITFLPQPKSGQSIESKRIEADEQFRQFKLIGGERVAVQIPNRLTDEETVEFLQMVQEVAQKNNVSVSTWESNWIGGSKAPFNNITLKLVEKHPNWFLHAKDGKIMIGEESGAKHIYPNPLNLELSKYVDSLRRKYSGIMGAKGLVVDDLAIPINEAQMDSMELNALIGVPINGELIPDEIPDPRLFIYKKKLQELRNFTNQVGIPLSLSSQNNTQTTVFEAFPLARNASVDEIIPQVYAQNNPGIFESTLKRTLMELNKTDRKIKVTPVLFAGSNSIEELQGMSKDASQMLGSKDIGVFPIAGLTSLANNNQRGAKNVFKR